MRARLTLNSTSQRKKKINFYPKGKKQKHLNICLNFVCDIFMSVKLILNSWGKKKRLIFILMELAEWFKYLRNICMWQFMSGYSIVEVKEKRLIFILKEFTFRSKQCKKWSYNQNYLEVWFLRRMLQIPGTTKKSSETALLETDTTRLLINRIRKHQVTIFCHVMRRDKLEHLATTGMIREKCRKGKQPEKILDELTMWLTAWRTCSMH